MLHLSSLLLLKSAEALLPLVVEGNSFYQLQPDYTKSAESFKVFGVDYQPGGSSNFSLSASADVLTDAAACSRDAYLLNKLGANAIRVYSVSPWLNHDKCMSIFNNAGIYVLLDVNTPDNSINRNDPQLSYNEGYLNNVFGLVDAFKKYPNLMGFIAGNEIVNDDASAKVDPQYLRAVIRDIKQYVQLWSNRTIPVGYAAADNLDYRDITFDYLQCNANSGNSTLDQLSRADFFGINSYTWCSGVNDFASSGYQDIISNFNQTSIPILFTEYGCNAKRPRTFDEVDQGVYGPLKDFVSGGFVYEYSNEANNYGLVNIADRDHVSLLQDYNNLQQAFANVTLTRSSTVATGTSVNMAGAPTCSTPSNLKSFNWNLSLPPCPAPSLLSSNGGNLNVGTLMASVSMYSSFTVVDANGNTLTPTLTYDQQYLVNYQTNVPSSILNQPVKGSASYFSALATADTAALYGKDTPSSTTAAASSAKSDSSTSSKKNAGSKTGVSAVVLGALIFLIVSLI